MLFLRSIILWDSLVCFVDVLGLEHGLELYVKYANMKFV
jgi:hypothetical protein